MNFLTKNASTWLLFPVIWLFFLYRFPLFSLGILHIPSRPQPTLPCSTAFHLVPPYSLSLHICLSAFFPSSFLLSFPSSHNLHHLHSSKASCGLTEQFPHPLSLPPYHLPLSFSSPLPPSPRDGKHHHLTCLLFQPEILLCVVRVKVEWVEPSYECFETSCVWGEQQMTSRIPSRSSWTS